MFFGLFVEQWLVSRYDYMFLMEPDCSAIKPNWLSHLGSWLDHPSLPVVWVAASVSRHPMLEHQPFLSGPGAYRLGDPDFNDFLAICRATHVGERV